MKKIAEERRLYAYRAADRRRDHRHHRGDCGPRSASRPSVGQRNVGDRLDARHQQRAGDLCVELRQGFYSPDLVNLGTGPGTPPTPKVNGFISPDMVPGSGVTVNKSGYQITMGSSLPAAGAAPASCNGLTAGAVMQGYNATATRWRAVGRVCSARTRAAPSIRKSRPYGSSTALAMTDTMAPTIANPIQ